MTSRDIKEQPSSASCISLILLLPVVLTVGPVVRAYVFTALWTWFAVPLGAPLLGFLTSYGLLALWALVTVKPPRREDEIRTPIEQWGHFIAHALVVPFAIYAMGWIAYTLSVP